MVDLVRQGALKLCPRQWSPGLHGICTAASSCGALQRPESLEVPSQRFARAASSCWPTVG